MKNLFLVIFSFLFLSSSFGFEVNEASVPDLEDKAAAGGLFCNKHQQMGSPYGQFDKNYKQSEPSKVEIESIFQKGTEV